MSTRPPVNLPSFDHLPARWSPADARLVLAALDASGLRPFEFARQTGLDPRRIWRARRTNESSDASTQTGGAIRLVELVARAKPRVGSMAREGTVAPVEMAPPADAIVPSPGMVAAVVTPPILVVPGVESTAECSPAHSPVVEVTTPTGWQLRVPGELLAGLVQALAARPC